MELASWNLYHRQTTGTSYHSAMRPQALDVGDPTVFVSGQFAGRTIRFELQELQKAESGRKYAKTDRRPLDPPPAVLLRLFETVDAETGQWERELLYENVLNVDLMCTFDLFPVPEAAYEVRSPGSTSSPEPSYATASYHASHLPASGSSIHQHSQSRYPPTYLLHPYMNVEADGSPSTKQPLQALPTSGHLCQSETPHDVVHRVGNHLITESSKLIAPLIGEKFVEPTLIEYEGRKALAFVFGDLNVRKEGIFVLRYRAFNTFSGVPGTQDAPIPAELYGAPFKVYLTREAPELESSTELTENLSNYNAAPLSRHISPHMIYPPAALLPTHSSSQRARCVGCQHASICSAHPLVTSDTMSAPTSSVIPPQPTSTSTMQMGLRYILAIFDYATRFLDLHHIWFNVYRLIPDASSGLENAPISRRSYWTETVQRMKRVWTLIIMVSSLITTLSVAFLQIDIILNNIYHRTFSILAFIFSSASLAASCIFIANEASLDSVEKFKQWEIASQDQHTPSSVDLWVCLTLPLTSLAWSVGFCLMTLFSLAWVDQGSYTVLAHTPKIGLAFSITIIFLVVLCIALQFYRVRNFLAK